MRELLDVCGLPGSIAELTRVDVNGHDLGVMIRGHSVDNPVLLPWGWESQASNGDRFWVRNPYFWEIDPEGNQLPYMDYHERWVAGNLEVLTAKVIAGEGTHASWYLTLPDYPLFKVINMIYQVAPGVLMEHGKAKNPWPNVDAQSGVIQWYYGVTQYEFYTVLFGIGRALGCLANITWDRALGYAIERPKSVTTAMLEEAAGI